MLLQIEEIKTLAAIEYVSVIGLMMLIIISLIWYIKRLLDVIKLKDEQIIGFVEKYYVLGTKIEETLNRIIIFMDNQK